MTSHAGLGLLRRLLSGLGLFAQLTRSQRKLGVGGDFGFAKVVLTMLARSVSAVTTQPILIDSAC